MRQPDNPPPRRTIRCCLRALRRRARRRRPQEPGPKLFLPQIGGDTAPMTPPQPEARQDSNSWSPPSKPSSVF
eukprot:scaffold19440_cov99-Isochrysis_galbana.AAC.3